MLDNNAAFNRGGRSYRRPNISFLFCDAAIHHPHNDTVLQYNDIPAVKYLSKIEHVLFGRRRMIFSYYYSYGTAHIINGKNNIIIWQ